MAQVDYLRVFATVMNELFAKYHLPDVIIKLQEVIAFFQVI